mgnify:CR=1 FL=1
MAKRGSAYWINSNKVLPSASVLSIQNKQQRNIKTLPISWEGQEEGLLLGSQSRLYWSKLPVCELLPSNRIQILDYALYLIPGMPANMSQP